MPFVDLFTVTGTWTKRSGTQAVEAYIVGGGGGGVPTAGVNTQPPNTFTQSGPSQEAINGLKSQIAYLRSIGQHQQADNLELQLKAMGG